MFERMRRNLARWIAPPRQTRAYAAAKNSRLTAGWGSANSSADSELSMSLTALRARSRALMRDAPYAKRARVIVTNNVVGSGVGMQCQVKTSRGELHERINADIEDVWRQWSKADSCHTGGTLHFSDLERALQGEIFTAGEAFVRIHRRPFGNSKIPFALELIEAERIADEFSNPNPSPTNSRADVRLGIEVDSFGRPLAYWVRERHPGELRTGIDASVRLERVPAADVLHLRIVDRWPQTRGEPWLHTVARKLNDMDGYSEAEIIAARGAASYMAFIETPDLDNPLGEKQDDGTQQMDLEPGAIDRLGPGEKLNFVSPNRPNPAMDPFMRMMLREVAAGIGVSYESLSRDYSQSNYSSSRLALLDDRDLWRVLQQWWARSFRQPLYEQWLQAAVLSRAVQSINVESYALKPEQFTAVTWKFRGWSWVDPTKEVNAYKEAVRAGFMTVSKVVTLTGGGDDIEDVIAERKRELQMFEDAEIDVDTTVEEPQAPAAPAAVQASQPADDAEGEEKSDEEPQSIDSKLGRVLESLSSLESRRSEQLTDIATGYANVTAELRSLSVKTTSLEQSVAALTPMVTLQGERVQENAARLKFLERRTENLQSSGEQVAISTARLVGFADAVAVRKSPREQGLSNEDTQSHAAVSREQGRQLKSGKSTDGSLQLDGQIRNQTEIESQSQSVDAAANG